MTASIIDGKLIAEQVRGEVAEEVTKLIAAGMPRPGLATVLVGDNPASHVYVKSKRKSCEELGIESYGFELPATATQEQLDSLLVKLNADPKVNGILVQLPLPGHLDEERALSLISIDKDVDGFHPVNVGRLAMKRRDPIFVPCTPAGCIVLLQRSGCKLEGKRAVVLGRSNIVGMPAALLLVRENATVTICHSKTQNLPDVVREADILIAAIGRARFVKGSWVKPGAYVIDVGINQIEDATKKSGHRLVGDVDFDEVKEVAGAITPVPGGVGPMTIAMLMRNVVRAAKAASKK
ncbi:MAG: bifunctional methylenetetrahydrofolate dehydrogenase/methenyltetrahydrofolate cyclohydrolase FolD [Chloroflexi bacterium]|nr:bifunctional methylenetetrahydrofolate dehydrogenase/methenyltetrahydrofolate cyclohydrolase FolD [Chloroflexota bacterium]